MRHLQKFEHYKFDEQMNEGLKDWIIAGALSMASVSGKGQEDMPKIKLGEPKQVRSVISADTLSFDFGSHFESGKHTLSQAKAEDTKIILNKIADFCKKNKGQKITIKIVASESLVPNKDAETGERLPRGGLAQVRVEETQDLIYDYLEKAIDSTKDITFESDTLVGKTPYIYGEDPRQEKFRKDQWVTIQVYKGRSKGKETDDYSAYGRYEGRIFVKSPYGGAKAIADIFIPSRKTERLAQQGNLAIGYQNLLFKSLKPDNLIAENPSEPYDGNFYLVPWDWWNGEAGPDGTKRQTTGIDITNDDWEYIKKNYKVN